MLSREMMCQKGILVHERTLSVFTQYKRILCQRMVLSSDLWHKRIMFRYTVQVMIEIDMEFWKNTITGYQRQRAFQDGFLGRVCKRWTRLWWRWRVPAWSDSRDEIIVHNQRRIQDLHKEFTRSVRDLKSQFDDYGGQSEQIQQAMLNRIIDLKQQIREKDFMHTVCGSPLQPIRRSEMNQLPRKYRKSHSKAPIKDD
jgi:hypothetical protein